MSFIICTKSSTRRVGWTTRVERTERCDTHKILDGKPRGKRHMVNLGVDGRIMLKETIINCMYVSLNLVWMGSNGKLL